MASFYSKKLLPRIYSSQMGGHSVSSCEKYGKDFTARLPSEEFPKARRWMVHNAVLVTVSLVMGTLLLLSAAQDSPYPRHRAYLGELDTDPDAEVMLEILAKLGQSIMRANDLEKYSLTSKRGLDLGLSRGFSGSQAAKHLMGLAAANYAGGPGRRRRHV